MTTTNGRMQVLEMEPDPEEVEALVTSTNGSTSVGIGTKRAHRNTAVAGQVMEQLVQHSSSPSRRKSVVCVILAVLLLVIVVVNIRSEGSFKVTITKKGGRDDDLIEFVDPDELQFVEQGDVKEDDVITFVEPETSTTIDGNKDTTATNAKDDFKKEDEATNKEETPQQQEEKPVEKKKKKIPWDKIPPLEPDAQRGPFDQAKKEELREKWGGWHFWDGDAENRPKEDFLSKHPNMDIPGDDFPENSWQVDAVYVNHFLDSASGLLEMAKEAIFTEYGHGKPLPPEGMTERIKMFHWEKLDLKETTSPPPAFAKRGERDIGGWTTKRSWDGLIRRLLHAMMTQDTFTVVLAGHSAAAGEG
jgi:hypothetical protein